MDFQRSIALWSVVGVIVGTSLGSAAASTGNHYGVTISTRPTKNMTFANGVYSATADNAVLNVNDLTHALAGGNVEVTTGNGGGGDEKGDLHVDAGFSWASSSALTLDAFHTIFVDQQVVAAGTGALTLTNNGGGSDGVLTFRQPGSISFLSTVNSLTIDGMPYLLENSIATLASAIRAKASGNYALANNYDAGKDGTYTASPIATRFGGSFEGLGNAISNLSILTNSGALFADSRGTLADLWLTNIKVMNSGVGCSGRERLGGLVLRNFGSVVDDHVDGTIQGEGYAGGLVSRNEGLIVSSSANVSVTACWAGGLAGTNEPAKIGAAATISQSYATGPVTGTFAGGLLSENNRGAVVTNSYSTGAASSRVVGGLFSESAYGDATISFSYSAGAVSGGEDEGGPGGFGCIDFDSTNDNYWDITTSGTSNSFCGEKGNAQGVTGLTTTQLQSGLPAGFDPTIWAENPSINNGLPYLIANPPPQ